MPSLALRDGKFSVPYRLIARDSVQSLRQVFYDSVQVPFRDLAEGRARIAGKPEPEVESAGETAARAALVSELQAVKGRIDTPPARKDELFFISTTDILKRLNSDKEAPWFGWSKGKSEELSAEKLSRILRPYKVKSIRLKRGTPHGYTLESLLPVFERYLSDTPDNVPADAPNASSSDPL